MKITGKIKILIGVPVGLFLLINILFVLYFVNSVENFKPLTFDEVLINRVDHFSEHFGIGDKKDPSDYGFSDFETVEYISEGDKIKLHAWHVGPYKKSSKQCILLIHGRGANKLRTMKYLQLFKDTGIIKDHGVFIPDLRNSGLSEKGKTLLGWKFAEDIHYTIKFLNKKYGYDTFVLYGFSMGAMASAAYITRPELQIDGIEITKILMDSPLASADAILYGDITDKFGLPGFMARTGLFFANLKSGGNLAKLKLANLLQQTDLPLLILQAENDPRTTIGMLRDELKSLDHKKNIEVVYYPVGEHVKLYQNEQIAADYIRRVADFIRR